MSIEDEMNAFSAGESHHQSVMTSIGPLVSPLLARRFLHTSDASDRVAVPSDIPSSFSAGTDLVRVLVYGDGITMGRGVTSHELGLAGPLSAALRHHLNRGVQVDMVLADSPLSEPDIAKLSARRVWRFDAIVVSLDLRSVPKRWTSARWSTRLEQVLMTLAHESPPGTPIRLVTLATAVAPDAQPTRETVIADWTESIVARFHAVEHQRLSAPVESADAGFSHQQYQAWGSDIARGIRDDFSTIVTGVEGLAPGGLRDVPDDELARQAAVDRAGVKGVLGDRFLQRLAVAARTMFGTADAQINFVGALEQQTVTDTRGNQPRLARDRSICQYTITGDGLTLIPDTWADPRVADAPVARGAHAVRFYAGYPLESPDGYRIGTLCVFDDAPREFTSRQQAMYAERLSELGFMVQRHIWERMAPEARVPIAPARDSRGWFESGWVRAYIAQRQAVVSAFPAADPAESPSR